MMKKRISYPRTTVSQRKLLFQIWSETGDLPRALSESRVSERTFYNWKPRFEQGGYEGLETFASHAPKHPNRIDEEIQQQVITLRRQHPNWGKRRIADELAKANDWTALVSPNTVRRILLDAGLWTVTKTPAKKRDT
jgi:transposase